MSIAQQNQIVDLQLRVALLEARMVTLEQDYGRLIEINAISNEKPKNNGTLHLNKPRA